MPSKIKRNIEIPVNLTPSEVKGLKTLKKRGSDGELIITETDKSRRISVLTVQQYLDAGKNTLKRILKLHRKQ